MSRRTIEVDGERWEVYPSGRTTAYDRDEFGLVFEKGTGPARVRRVTRFSPTGARRWDAALAELTEPGLRDLFRQSQPAWTSPETSYAGNAGTVRIDLHVHSTASDGEHAPADVVRRAAAAGLDVFALTDHDTVAGVAEARDAGSKLGVSVIAGCEFSVAGPGGEMHLLAYFLPVGDPVVESFLVDQRAKRQSRAVEMIRRLGHAGVNVTEEQVSAIANGGSWGRPHVARAIVAAGKATTLQDAFDKYIGFGRPAFVGKVLPTVEAVTGLVRSVAGVTSAAHLKDRGVRPVLQQLKNAGVDSVEVMHSSHDEHTVTRIGRLAGELGMLQSGGTDWHGELAVDRAHAPLGSLPVPHEWLVALEGLHRSRERQEAGT